MQKLLHRQIDSRKLTLTPEKIAIVIINQYQLAGCLLWKNWSVYERERNPKTLIFM